jgi:hypothetical protein
MKVILTALVCCAFTAIAVAQGDDIDIKKSAWSLPKAEIGVGIQVIVPTGSFKENTESIPGGLVGHYYHRVGSKFMLGGEISAACISHNSFDVELPNGDMATLSEDENMWGLMLGGRFNFIGNAKMRSYSEVRVGMNTFYTSVSSCNESLEDYSEARTHGTSFVSSFGMGLNIDPKAIFKNESGRTWIAFKGAYVVGTNVNYRSAPETMMRAPLDQHVYNSNLGYFEIGVSASWQLR